MTLSLNYLIFHFRSTWITLKGKKQTETPEILGKYSKEIWRCQNKFWASEFDRSFSDLKANLEKIKEFFY